LSVLYDHVRDFSVYVDDKKDRVLGCCALQFCWENLAEIRSLAVHPGHQRNKIGSKLTETVLEEAKSFAIKEIFFEIDRSQLPLKIWADCITCVKFPDCDETAMMKEL
ncbi:MAG: GNAT family N-acetyltransferase, partial [Deltaproteobacteria bacterium]|nr:GNAT family N-acetyltransferase [Deltaproteobacteria bacterium]